MFGKHRHVIICSFLIAWFAFGFVAESKAQDQSARWEPLLQAVENILAGKNFDTSKVNIASGARLVCGSEEENLLDVVKGKSKTCSLKEDSSRGAIAANLKLNTSDNAAFLVLKTQTPKKTDARFHTVVFMKATNGRWAIECWHTCN